MIAVVHIAPTQLERFYATPENGTFIFKRFYKIVIELSLNLGIYDLVIANSFV